MHYTMNTINTITTYIDNYTKLDYNNIEKNEKDFFDCLYPDCQCILIRNDEDFGSTKKNHYNTFHDKHFGRIQEVEVTSSTITKLGDYHFKHHITYYQIHQGVKHFIEDYQEFKVDPNSGLIIYVKHDWHVK